MLISNSSKIFYICTELHSDIDKFDDDKASYVHFVVNCHDVGEKSAYRSCTLICIIPFHNFSGMLPILFKSMFIIKNTHLPERVAEHSADRILFARRKHLLKIPVDRQLLDG